ncbi:hypothetical protein Salat_2429000 [Sesamum alatum]|uniref:Uncharacterized protein n=1 Tax=Sesamum alatum TaxID=300844 RepID=A0AAE1XY06_9LAMI|nr:hypothetical protein Salat_2429000 [Sesamum alatum]
MKDLDEDEEEEEDEKGKDETNDNDDNYILLSETDDEGEEEIRIGNDAPIRKHGTSLIFRAGSASRPKNPYFITKINPGRMFELMRNNPHYPSKMTVQEHVPYRLNLRVTNHTTGINITTTASQIIKRCNSHAPDYPRSLTLGGTEADHTQRHSFLGSSYGRNERNKDAVL